MPGLSRTFATDVMCHPMLLELCDRILLPSCSRYQLNLGHLLQRGPGAEDQWLHRDELVWSDVPWPHPQLQVASVIAFVDFTRDNGATRVVPGSHRWPDRGLPALEQMQEPRRARTARVRRDAGRLGGHLPRRNHPCRRSEHHRRTAAGRAPQLLPGWLRTEENNYLSIPPSYVKTLPRLAQELLGYSVHDSIDRGGGYLGMVRMQDPVELIARGELG